MSTLTFYLDRSPDSPGPRQRESVDGAVAESSISFNTLATGLSGVTGETIRLSQFPPPPETLPNTPMTAGFNIAGSVGTRSSPSAIGVPSFARNLPSSPLKANYSRTPSPSQRTPGVSPLPSPALAACPSAYPRQVVPTDWHDGSSSIDVQPFEAKMLSTSAITELLSSADSTISSGSELMAPIPAAQRKLGYRPGSQFSEMTYPPTAGRASPSVRSQLDHIHDVLATVTDDAYLLQPQSANGGGGGDNDTIASFDGNAQIVRYAGVSRKVSVVGMAQARSQQFPSVESTGVPSLSDSLTTFNSHHPLQRQLSIPHTAEELERTPLGNPPSAMRQVRTRRASTYSNKSMKSQVSSFISTAGESAARFARSTAEWFRVKPLPPVPTRSDLTLEQERRYKQADYAQPLPALAARAQRLEALVAQGRLPANSMYSGEMLGGEGYEKLDYRGGDARASALRHQNGGRKRTSVSGPGGFALAAGFDDSNGPGSPSKTRRPPFRLPATRKGRVRLAILASVATVIIIVAIVVGVVVGRHHGANCSGNTTGAACTLDATCVCTPQSGQSQCTPVAASLINMVPTVNSLFGANITQSDVATSVLVAFGRASNCATQAQVIDVATALDASTVPNRTAWAQAALMWSFVLSESPSTVSKLQDFVRSADWQSVNNVDGPIPAASSRFSTTQMGFTFDFAGQVISPASVSFATVGQASSAQLAQLTDTTSAALDRVYSYATAMSTIQATALSTYWTSILKRNASDLAAFASLFAVSPILLPFNAANSSVAPLLTASTSAPFPPPAACYPGLSASAIGQLSSVETQAFGLPSPSVQTSFQTSCYTDRPVYGVLDYLRLRLPHRDTDQKVAMQAAVLTASVRPRVVLNNGAQFNAIQDGVAPATVQTDVRWYGTLSQMNHVLVKLFAAIPSTDVANALVEYVLSNPDLPPSNTSVLAQNINSLPIIEAAVIGSVLPGDIAAVYSSFSDPSGKLFFGTDGSLAMRTWALNATGTYVAWAESAAASQIVHDDSFGDTNFNQVWNPAFAFFHTSSNAIVGVSNVTTGLEVVNKFSSS